MVYKLLELNVTGNQELTIRAKTCEGDLELSVPVTTDSFIEGNSLHQLFARKMIQELEEKHPQNLSQDSKTFITELGLKYKVASKFTSFVGVDEKQNLIGIMRTRHVANQLPAGGSRFRTVQQFGGFRGGVPAPAVGISFGAAHAPQRSGGSRGGAPAQPPPPQSTGFSFGAAQATQRSGGSRGGAPAPPPPPQSFGAAQQHDGFGPPGGVLRSKSASASTNPIGFGASAATRSPASSFGGMIEEQGLYSGGRGPFNPSENQPNITEGSSFKLTLCQNASGSFPADASTAFILGCDLQQLIDSAQLEEPEVWTTMVCLVYLQVKCRAERDSWELVADKATKWLFSRGVIMTGAVEQKARELLGAV